MADSNVDFALSGWAKFEKAKVVEKATIVEKAHVVERTKTVEIAKVELKYGRRVLPCRL